MKLNNNTNEKQDFFSELLFDFVQYDLFDPYLHYRLPELLLISTCFKEIKISNTHESKTTKLSLELRDDSFKQLVWFGPILEEIFENQKISDQIHNLNIDQIQISSTVSSCVCNFCQLEESKTKKFITFLKETLGLGNHWDIQYPFHQYIELLEKIRCPLLLNLLFITVKNKELYIPFYSHTPPIIDFGSLEKNPGGEPRMIYKKEYISQHYTLRAAVFLRDFEMIELWIIRYGSSRSFIQILIDFFDPENECYFQNMDQLSRLIEKICYIYNKRTNKSLQINGKWFASIFLDDVSQYEEHFDMKCFKEMKIYKLFDKWDPMNIKKNNQSILQKKSM